MTTEDMETTRNLIIDLLVEVKSATLRAGAVPTKHIDQIQDRIRAAARQSASVEEWYTTLARKLQLAAPSQDASRILDELAYHVKNTIGSTAFLDMVEREHGYLIAAMRLANEQRRLG